MDLRTYLMIKQADIGFKRKDGTIVPSTGTATLNPEPLVQQNEDPITLSKRLLRQYLQDEYGPKGVVPVMHNTPTYGKRPVKALPGIGPMPAGLDYGK